jgi:hypothetical protein
VLGNLFRSEYGLFEVIHFIAIVRILWLIRNLER